MANGWEGGGSLNDSSSHRLVCASPPGAGAGAEVIGSSSAAEAAKAFRPNVFTGLWPLDTTPPTIALGIDVFSFEFWWAWRWQEPSGADARTLIGFAEIDGGLVRLLAGFEFFGTALTARGVYDDPIAPGQIRIVPDTAVPYGWHHMAINFNRTGNMTVYIDGIAAAGAVAINANNIGTPAFYALSGFVSDTGTVAWCDAYTSTQLDAAGVVGPVAVHTGLLTLAQLQNSVRGKRVQNLATTVISWDWRRIEGQTAWETDTARMMQKVFQIMDTRGIAAPIGAATTVTVLDLSGNGNNWTLPTATAYGTEAPVSFPLDLGDKATIGFMVDPFFSS